MTPGARVAAAIEVLETWLDGVPAEKALLKWARASRYAGSKDRAAVRDHVFQALRCLRSYAALGGAGDTPSGRQLMIGALRDQGADIAGVFNGVGHAPAPLSGDEERGGCQPAREEARVDMPDWLWPHMQASLGESASAEAALMRARAPVFVRVNTRKASVERAQEALAADGIDAIPHGLARGALELTEGARKLRQSDAFAQGFVELQDVASQAVVEALPLECVARALDYCAGGGGKALAMAAACDARIFAHDIAPERMKDIPDRAARAGVEIGCLTPQALGQEAAFDLVFCDAPCSGSGAWRRAPEGKWRLTQARLDTLCETQLGVLQTAAGHVSEGGALAYATCSLLSAENEQIAERFVRARPEWTLSDMRHWRPSHGGDGFFFALFARS